MPDRSKIFQISDLSFSINGYVCLTIEDNGAGMDENTCRRIFEPFFTTRFQGKGLGMSAAYGIIKNHGGWISVNSETGKGSKVRIFLPKAEIAPEAEGVIGASGNLSSFAAPIHSGGCYDNIIGFEIAL